MSYILPIFFAAALHLVLAYSFHQSQSSKLNESRALPRHIQAELFDIKALSTATKKEVTKAKDAKLDKKITPPKPKKEEPVEKKIDKPDIKKQQAEALEKEKKQREIDRQKKAEERKKQEEALKKELEKKEAAAKKQREIESKRKLEAQKKIEQEKAEKEKKRKAAEEKKKKEALAAQKKAAEEKKRKAQAAERKKQLAKKQAEAEKARIKALQQQEAEEAQFAAEQIARELASGIDVYIKTLLKGNFRIPSTARNGIKALVRIRLLTSGKVVAVEMVESSGNAAFDRAAEQAVWRTESFPKVADIARTSPSYFNRELRTFLMSFKPEELRW